MSHRSKTHLIPECQGCGKPFYAADRRNKWCPADVCQRAKEQAHKLQCMARQRVLESGKPEVLESGKEST